MVVCKDLQRYRFFLLLAKFLDELFGIVEPVE
jgi:hypothetical protein